MSMIDLNDYPPAPSPFIDLNEAGPQVPNDRADGQAFSRESDHDEIKEALRSNVEALVCRITGHPANRALSTAHQGRWGTKGSLHVDLDGPTQGRITDHEGGDGHDPIGYIMAKMSLSYPEAIEWARTWLGMQPAPKPRRTANTGASPKPNRDLSVSDILGRCRPIDGTLGETYLRTRGLSLPLAGNALRYSDDLPYNNRATPSIVAQIRFADGALTGGIHRTFLADDGSAKLDRKMLGPHKGDVDRWGQVPLGALDGRCVYGVGEGIETTLSGMQIFGIPGAAGLDAGGVGGFDWPQGTRELVIFADAGTGGEVAAQKLAARAVDAALVAWIVRPVHGDDLNDDLRKGATRADYEAASKIERRGPSQANATPDGGDFQRLQDAASSLAVNDALAVSALLVKIVQARLSEAELYQILMIIKATSRIPKGALDKMLNEIKKKLKSGNASKPEPAWMKMMLLNDFGSPHAHEENVIKALSNAPEWAGVIAYDEFALRIMILQPPPWNDGPFEMRPWQDVDDTRVACWFQAHGINASVSIVNRAIDSVARSMGYHPVREYLDGLKWDGVPRIERWVIDYLGAEDTQINRVFSSRWMIGAVARIMNPGCKSDHMLILEGAQGVGKSTALQVLGEPWFTDRISDIGSKDSLVEMSGVWIVEIAELDGMSKAEVGKVKAFLTSVSDRFRPPYGRAVVDVKRQCVFTGSVNHKDYQRDETGARRFWPIATTKANVKGLKQVRDQLWAEAAARYREGAIWWIASDDEATLAAAREQQEQRMQEDAWGSAITAWLGVLTERVNYGTPEYPDWKTVQTVRVQPLNDVSISEILKGAIGLETGRWTRGDQMRVAAWLKANEWERYQHWAGTTKTWRYRKA